MTIGIALTTSSCTCKYVNKAKRKGKAASPSVAAATVASSVGGVPSAGLGGALVEPVGHRLLGLPQQLHQTPGHVLVALAEEGGRTAGLAHSPRPSDPVHVLLNVRRQIEVDHVL